MKRKHYSFLIIGIGIIGFIWSQNQKAKYRIFSNRLSGQNEFRTKVGMQPGSSYLISFWGNDEESGLQQWAEMEFTYKIETQSGLQVATNSVIANESEEKGGIRRAANGNDVKFEATRAEDLIVTAVLIEGDYLDIEIYKNLPKKTYWFPVLFIAIFIFGVVFYLKSGNLN